MGYPYDELVPAAILSDNPGVNLKEYGDLLMQANSSPNEVLYYSFASRSWDPHFRQIWVPDPNQSEAERWIKPKGHMREYTRAEQRATIWKCNLARWDNREMFRDIDKRHIGSHYQKLPVQDIHGREFGIARILGLDSRRLSDYALRRFRDCDVFYDENWFDTRKVFYGVIERKNEKEMLKFETAEDLAKKFPSLNIRKIRNFNQKRGEFSRVGDVKHFWDEDKKRWNRVDTNAFRWFKKGDGYYFDEDHFLRDTHAGGDLGHPGYTDFILTRECVRQGAWKVLTYRGRSHMKNAFRRFPKIKEAYDRAVWDSHSSLGLKEMSEGKARNFDLMRWRLEQKVDAINGRKSIPLDQSYP